MFTTPLSSTNISSSYTPCSVTTSTFQFASTLHHIRVSTMVWASVRASNSAHNYPTAGFWWETCRETLSFVLFKPPDHIHHITTRKEANSQIWRGLKTCSTMPESTFKRSHCELGRKYASSQLVRWRAAFCWSYFLLTQDNQSLDVKPWH